VDGVIVGVIDGVIDGIEVVVVAVVGAVVGTDVGPVTTNPFLVSIFLHNSIEGGLNFLSTNVSIV
jgi:hypothetical protein